MSLPQALSGSPGYIQPRQWMPDNNIRAWQASKKGMVSTCTQYRYCDSPLVDVLFSPLKMRWLDWPFPIQGITKSPLYASLLKANWLSAIRDVMRSFYDWLIFELGDTGGTGLLNAIRAAVNGWHRPNVALHIWHKRILHSLRRRALMLPPLPFLGSFVDLTFLVMLKPKG